MEPEQLKQDRRRFHAHTATFLLGFGGWLFVFAFERLIVAAVIPWLLVGFSLLLTASGGLAIAVGRTFVSGPVEIESPSDPHADLGDALTTPGLHTGDLWPAYSRATAPYALLGLALALLAVSGYFAVRAIT